MAVGALIRYRLKLFGVPFRWLTAIDEWSPEESFVDTQIRGPYWLWRHTHTFEEIDSRRALMRDRAEYRLLYGAMGRISHALFIRRTLDRIFDYRAEMIARLLAPDDQSNVIQFPIKSSSLPEHPEVA